MGEGFDMKTLCLTLWLTVLISAAASVHARSDSIDATPTDTGKPCRVVRALDGHVVCARHEHRSVLRQAPAQQQPRHPAQGYYVVIGSFGDEQNATNWARFNRDFGTEVQRVALSEPAVYRVLVGPLSVAESHIMREILQTVGLDGTWRTAVCGGAVPVTGAECDALLASR